MNYEHTQRLVRRLIVSELEIDELSEDDQNDQVALEVASYGDVFSPLTWREAFIDKQTKLLLAVMDEPSYFLEVHLLYFSKVEGWYPLIPEILDGLILRDPDAAEFIMEGFQRSKESPDYGADVDSVKTLEGEILEYGKNQLEGRGIKSIQGAR
ncbi:hypothetical protein [Chroococcidiopsis sp.]|uniref:hypothetical protein n=1 Tax=Chroococcidiopsis sp. TaxID=3088168 RepID=UPI003F2D9079